VLLPGLSRMGSSLVGFVPWWITGPTGAGAMARAQQVGLQQKSEKGIVSRDLKGTRLDVSVC